MNKQQKLKIALPLLAVVMFFVWKPVIMGSGAKKSGSKDSVPSSGQSALPASLSRAGLVQLAHVGKVNRVRSKFTDWDRNPFVLGQKQDTLMIEGILWDERNPSVMINGNILGVGDKVGDTTVVDIKPNSVTLKDKKGEFELGPGGSR